MKDVVGVGKNEVWLVDGVVVEVVRFIGINERKEVVMEMVIGRQAWV